MQIYKMHFVLIILFSLRAPLYSQSSISQKSSAAPSANNFTYPQSLFVDSQNGHIWVTDFDNHRVLRFDVSSLTTVERLSSSSYPREYFLAQNYPNPFNPATQILFSINTTSHASLTVYNVLGQEVAALFNEVATANTVYSIPFDAKNLPRQKEGGLASGIYLYSLRFENGYEVKKMCLLK